MAQTVLYTVWCSFHCDKGLCVNSFPLIRYEHIKENTTGEKSDIEML